MNEIRLVDICKALSKNEFAFYYQPIVFSDNRKDLQPGSPDPLAETGRIDYNAGPIHPAGR